METEGRKIEDRGPKEAAKNNVVPFPRDWLGPREELIPFGGSAFRSPSEGTSAPRAEAFWGGDSGPLDAVLPALTGCEPSPTVAGPRLRGRSGRLAAAGIATVVLAAALYGRIAGVPTTGSGPAVGSGVTAAGFVDLALLRGAVGVPDIESPKAAVRKPVRRRAHTVARVKRPTRSVAPSTGSTEPAAQTFVSQPQSSGEASTTSSSAPHSSGSTSTSSSTSISGAGATSAAPVHSAGSSHAASVRPGPVGPGAPFGPGQLK